MSSSWFPAYWSDFSDKIPSKHYDPYSIWSSKYYDSYSALSNMSSQFHMPLPTANVEGALGGGDGGGGSY